MAQMPEEELHGVLRRLLANKDEGLREAAAEGFARLKNPVGPALGPERVRERKQNRAAPVAGLRPGLARQARHGRVRPAALPGEQSELQRLPRHRTALSDRTRARSASPRRALPRLCATPSSPRTRKPASPKSWHRAATTTPSPRSKRYRKTPIPTWRRKPSARSKTCAPDCSHSASIASSPKRTLSGLPDQTP